VSQSVAHITHVVDPSLLRGCAEVERTERGWLPHRLPRSARDQCSDAQLHAAESQPSGVRLVFRSKATVVELDLLRTTVSITGMPARPDGRVDLVVDGQLTDQKTTSAGDVVRVNPASGESTVERGTIGTSRFSGLPAHDKTIEIWLPNSERTELVGLRTDHPIQPPPPDGRRVWIHHGSSISQGSNAAGPSTTWPAIAAALAGVEPVNLGLAGSAMLDQFTARAIRDARAEAISVKIGINLVNTDLLRHRAFAPAVHGFLDTIRDGHADVPLLVVGPLYCPIHETTPGPAAFDVSALAAGEIKFQATGDPDEAARPGNPLGKLTLTHIRDQLETIVAQRSPTDPLLHYLDGLSLYGPADSVEHPLPDNLHPDARTHHMIGERFAHLAFGTTGVLSPDAV